MESKLMASTLNISKKPSESRRKIRKRLANESLDEILKPNAEEFKRNVYQVLFDRVIVNISRRYETANEIDKALNYPWKYNLYEEEICQSRNFVEKYHNDVSEELTEELLHLKIIHDDVNIKNDLLLLILLNKIIALKLGSLFSNISIGLRIFCMLPVTVAQTERIFSRMVFKK